MSKKNSKELYDKYLNAETSLQEENELFNTKTGKSEIDSWGQFVKNNRRTTPKSLKSSVLQNLDKRKNRQRWMYSSYGIAASIVLLLGVFIFQNNEDSEYEKKQAMLKEALSMFPDETEEQQSKTILYEDESVVIYLGSE